MSPDPGGPRCGAGGGDEGVRVMVEGAALARRRHDRFKFLLVGDEARIKAALDSHPNLRAASEILHSDDVITGDDKPSQALRRAKTTSMGMAINAVKAVRASARSHPSWAKPGGRALRKAGSLSATADSASSIRSVQLLAITPVVMCSEISSRATASCTRPRGM